MEKMKYASALSERFYQQLIGDLTSFPATFSYAGKSYHGFPADTFKLVSHQTKKTDEKHTDVFILSAPENLMVEVKTAYWIAYGVSEWTIGFENRGTTDTALLENVYCCDLTFTGENPVLRGILGDHENLYRPYVLDLSEKPVHFESVDGRPTHVNFPYFNLEHGNAGTLLAIGWAGSWSADFSSDGDKVHFLGRSTVGMHLFLHPGERIRTALTVFAPYYTRNEYYAMNFWRSWFINCNMPKEDSEGNSLKPFSTCCLASDTGLPNSDGSISERYSTWRPSLEKMFEVGAKVDYRWIDAGWYCDPSGNTVESDWWGTIGTWTLDPVKWPGKTMRESTDFTKANGMKTLLWFEPERVTDPESLERNFGYDSKWAIRMPGEVTITNNLGNNDCLAWTTTRICNVLRENGIDMYREDNNSNPGTLWRYLDNIDGRIGITECFAVMAHYKMWDDIIETTKGNGGCAFCDSCASGGGRNDIESLRRGIPILRSDNDRTTTALRLSMTSSFNQWIPFCGANTKEKIGQLDPTGRSDVYTWRSSYLPVLNVDSQFVQDPDQDFDILRFGMNEWKTINRYLLCDFYNLTPWHSQEDKNGFTALSYVDTEDETGVLFVFRMEDCEDEQYTLNLPFANDGGWELTDADDNQVLPYLPDMILHLAEKRTAKLYFVKKK